MTNQNYPAHLKLNIGCGHDIREGFINMDVAPLGPWVKPLALGMDKIPFKDESVSLIILQDVLEHIANINYALKECHRVLIKKGSIIVRVPHFSYHRAFEDPTHIRFYAIRTFDFFLTTHNRSYQSDFSFSSITTNLRFLKKWYYPLNLLTEPIVNFNKYSQYLYESSCLRSFFPAENIMVILTK